MNPWYTEDQRFKEVDSGELHQVIKYTHFQGHRVHDRAADLYYLLIAPYLCFFLLLSKQRMSLRANSNIKVHSFYYYINIVLISFYLFIIYTFYFIIIKLIACGLMF